MAVYESVSSNFIATGGDSITVTKPTGLAVGNLMVAGIYERSNGVSSITAPAGWTQLTSTGIGSGGRQILLRVFSKTADSSDVAASDFTFTISNASSDNNTGGIIVRLSSPGILAGSTTNSAESVTSLTLTGFTPTRANSLYLFFAGAGTDANATQSITGVSIATDNPTWTSRASVGQNTATRDDTFVLFTATRSQTSATGTATVSITSSPATNVAGGALIAISPQVNGSITQETKVNAYAFSPIPVTTINANVDEPTLRERGYTAWTNEPLPTTDWQNETL